MSAALFETSIASLPLVGRGKVRDIYSVDERRLLIVTTDRLSAFDVILPDPIPDKGRVLTQLSSFWFHTLAHVIANHLSGIDPESVVGAEDERAQVRGRSVVAWRLKPLPIEAVVRGYLIGSGWKDYQRSGSVCGVALPPGIKQAGRLPEPIFTPTTKAAAGAHDESMDFAAVERLVGTVLAARVREVALALYREAAAYAAARGILIADTKFEFGVAKTGELYLIDELLTPDSSRFWPADQYREGRSPPSFDKQLVRDYLETLDWDKRAPGPKLPPEIIARTSEKYLEALARLTARP